MIYVTHDQVEAMTLADKVVVLNGGRVEQVGSPLELYHSPANLFVAGFLGTPKMGFLKGRLSRVDGQGCEVLLEAGTRIQLPQSGAHLSVDSPVTLGIRPEHLELARPGDCTLLVTADVSERLGSDTFCHVVTTSGEALTMRIRGDLASAYGQQLSLNLDAEHCHLFDADGVAVARPLRAAA
jgi:multiple sugar transport system ATP-binding protein